MTKIMEGKIWVYIFTEIITQLISDLTLKNYRFRVYIYRRL